MATRAIGKTKPIAKKAAPVKKVAKAAAAPKVEFKNPFAKAAPAPKAAPKGTKAIAKKAPVKAVKKVAPKAVKKAAPKAVKKGPTIKLSAPKIPSGRGKTPPPASKSYPSIADKAGAIKFKGISGSGLFPSPTGGFKQPDFSDPKLQKARDPAFYAAAAAARAAKLTSSDNFILDDGLTDLERRQRKTQANFLTGSARSQKDESAIIGEIEAPAFGGLSADRFQLLFISVFGLFTLVGSLANSTPYTTGL
eukprot:CAMPEP_0182507030 /NCGR_PEP_ID=MMETSP1321-20130603/22399_1 /TAXON_ID=91990 /ORGANISM="Bolidomonas sp., Strain RCC1657" /LENGTH=249 /DNA_ID=CAMNT_0024712865 /DNA_START=95 /DNA_END=844 /DNA_ORIENTATION=-